MSGTRTGIRTTNLTKQLTRKRTRWAVPAVVLGMLLSQLTQPQAVFPLSLAGPTTAFAANTLYVDGASGNDTNTCTTSSTPCQTISAAITHAASGDTIDIAPGTYPEHITMSQDVALVGANTRTTIADGSANGTVITVSSGATVTLQNLTIQNGSAAQVGGGISSSGTLTVLNSTITGNAASQGGNTIGYGGGGIAIQSGTTTIRGSTIENNTTTSFGAGIDILGGTATVTNSTIANNQDTTGGGGSGIITWGGASLNISSSTVAYNTGSTVGGDGIYNYGTATVKSTIVAGNGTSDCRNDNTNNTTSGLMTDAGYNIDGGTGCGFTSSTSKQSTDPLFASAVPTNNGGPTDTLGIKAGSPAIGNGNCIDISGNPVTTDQRGVTRAVPACSIGAFEAFVQPTFTAGQNGTSSWAGTVQNPLTITGSAPPNATVSLYGGGNCNGATIASAPADGSGNWTIPITYISSEGSYTYSATSTTGSTGVSGCSSPITVTIDRTAPTSTVTFPALGTNPVYLNAAGWSAGCRTPTVDDICGTATDSGSGVAAVYVAIEASNGTFWNGPGSGNTFSSSGTWVKANGTTSWSLPVPRPIDGTYTVASAAVDNAGNVQQVFQQSIAGICDPSQSGGTLSLNGGTLSINGGLCTVEGTNNGSPVSGTLSLNGGSLSLNGGSLSLNGGSLSLNGGSLSLNGGNCTLRDNSGNSATYTVAAASTGSLSLSSTGGTLSLNGGSLSLNGGSLSLNGGSLSLNGGSLSLNGGSLPLNGGSCSLTASNGSGKLSLNGGSLSLNGGSLSLNGGSLSLNGGSLSLNGGSLSLNGGSLSINGGAGGNAGNVVVDNTPPVVSSFSVDDQSGDGAQNINPAALFHIQFSKSMLPSTVNSTTVSVTPAPNTPPTCDAVDPTCQNAGFSGFQPNTYYTVTVNGATDLAGNAIATTNPTTFHFTTANAPPVSGTSANDADGDGIPNAWDGTTTPTFTLAGQSTNTAAWGFSSQHKDLCLVENYMSGQAADGTSYDQHISQAANQAIVNAFANSPVTNPDGTTGVHLVIFEGPNYSAGLPAGYPGPYFGGEIGMTDPLGDASTGSFNWAAKASGTSDSFDSIRRANFLHTGLSQFCHYAVIAHTLGGTGSSGASRGIGASEFVIALGGTIVGKGVGTQQEQQGTVMHELGHNLGLHHGGGPGITDLDVNYKPDYMSVMNYFYQFEGLPGGFTSNGLDYSHGTIMTPLGESGLNDSAGLGSGALLSSGAIFGTRYFCGGGATANIIADATQPINWSCTSSGAVPAGTSVQADINGDGSTEVLHDYNDWANLNFNKGDIGFGSVPPPPVMTTVDISNGPNDPYDGGPDSAPTVESKAVAHFTWTGFFAPISSDTTGTVANTGKAGRTYPVKFQLKDGSGNYVSTLSAVRSITYSISTACSGGTTETIAASTTSASGLHYDATANQYMYNWKTPASSGCYMLQVNLADGTTYRSLFSLS